MLVVFSPIFVADTKIIFRYDFVKRLGEVLLAKDKMNTIWVLISKDFIDSYISHEKSLSVNNVLKEYDNMKEAIIQIMNIPDMFKVWNY